MVLLLEDLQWSRSDSLKLLGAIHPLAPSMPLLVVATPELTGAVRRALAAGKLAVAGQIDELIIRNTRPQEE